MAISKDRQSPGRTRPGLWVVPPQQHRRPAPRPPGGRTCDDPDVRVRGIIYAWLVYEIDPRTGRLLPPDPRTGERRTRLDYVGQTKRALQTRAGEHMEDKPWADIVVGELPIIVDEGNWTKAERDAKEIAAIKRIRPRYNHDDNLDNPERIEIYRQVDQRHVRDKAAGRAPWLPLERRSIAAQVVAERAVIGAGLDGHEPRYPLTVLAGAAVAVGRLLLRLPRRLRLALCAVLGWVIATHSGAGWLITYVAMPPRYAYAGAAVLFGAVVVGLIRARPVQRWMRRKRR